jgi:PAS domain S-box-containing protein/putative nucleotidyltransferase with HDIG domain
LTGSGNGISEQVLIEFEHYIKDIWAFLPTPITYVSPLGVILDLDKTLEQMLHCSKEEVVGRSLADFVCEKEKIEELQRLTFENGFVRNFVCTLRSNNENMIPVSISTLLRKTRDDEIIGYFAAFVDMTDNKSTEELLRRTAQIQEQLLETARYLTESLDIKEVLARVGSSARDLLKAHGCVIYLLASDKRTLTPVVAIDPPYEREIMATPLDVDASFTGAAIKEGKAKIFNDTRENPIGCHIPGTPEERDEHAIVAPFIIDGEKLGAMCLNRNGQRFEESDLYVAEMFATYATTALRNARTYNDLQQEIQQRRYVQQALESEKAHLEQLFETAQQGIAVTDLNGKVQRINEGFSKIFGYTREEVAGKPIDRLIAPPDELDEARALTERAGRGESIACEAVRRHKDGSLIDVSVLAAPIIVNQKLVAVYAIYRDITSRKHAERRLRESEEKYRNFFENSNDAIFIHDLDGNIIDINSSVLNLFGYSKEEIRSLKIKDLHPVDEYAKSDQAFRDVSDKGFANFVIYFKKSNGETFPAEVSSSLFEVSGKKVIQGVVRDISERRKAEVNMRESEERYRELVEKAGAAILIDDRDGKFKYCNRRLADMFGFQLDEMLTKDIRSIVHPHDLDRVLKFHHDRINGKKAPVKYEFMGTRKDGKVIHLEIDAVALKAGEKTIGTRSYIWDITERKNAEEAIRSSEERLKLLFEFAPDGYYLMDLKGTFLDGNRAAEDMTAFKKEELIGKNFAKTKLLSVNQMPKALALLARNAVGQPTGPDEFTLNRKDGSKTIVGIRTFPVRMDGQTVVLGIARDITDYKRTQDELRRSYERMQKVLEDTINALTSAVEKRDPYTAGHQHRVAVLVDAIAEKMRLPDKQKEGLHVAALVHDIGKINVPAGILNKPSGLSDAEFALVKDHVLVGYDILRTIEFPWPVAEIVLQHHERLDGSGYPKGLKDGEIMLEAKILAVADVVESMLAHRPYRPARGMEDAVKEVKKYRRKLYDTKVVNACLKVLKDKNFNL